MSFNLNGIKIRFSWMLFDRVYENLYYPYFK